jgi:hypothetical protein
MQKQLLHNRNAIVYKVFCRKKKWDDKKNTTQAGADNPVAHSCVIAA